MKVKVNKSFDDCNGTRNIICPFCGYEDDNTWEQDESEEEIECCNCGRSFDVEVEYTVSYTTSPINTTYKDMNWKEGTYFEDGCITQEDEDWCDKQFHCEKEGKND